MKEHGILFSAPMVRAILEGRKTQTRRIVKPQPDCFSHADWPASPSFRAHFNEDGSLCCGVCGGKQQRLTRTRTGVTGIRNPYGAPGDRLWVKETWYESGRSYQTYPEDDEWKGWSPRGHRSHEHIRFAVDGLPPIRGAHEWGNRTEPEEGCTPDEGRNYWRKRPSIFMPRWASRILLEVVSVRVERLQEISDADAVADGVTIRADAEIAASVAGAPETPARMEYWHLWESINGPGSWDLNPWVWVVEFKRLEVPRA